MKQWLTPNLDFRIINYNDIRGDRGKGVGGGCVTFIKRNIPFQVIGKGKEEEYIVVEIWTKQGQFVILNYYNQEMRRAIENFRLTSPGKDQICYIMLKHLGFLTQSKLLGVYNKVWKEGSLPTSWKDAVIIPILKPGKDPTNYRPIALTSHVGKIMERMIVDRMTFYIEKKRIVISLSEWI